MRFVSRSTRRAKLTPRQGALAPQLANQIPSLLGELAEEQAWRREGTYGLCGRALPMPLHNLNAHCSLGCKGDNDQRHEDEAKHDRNRKRWLG